MEKPEKEEKKEPEPFEILSDIEDYQKKMESQWETDRSSYQQKIDSILGDFLKQAKESTPDQMDLVSGKRTDSLFSQAENVLHSIEKKARELTGKKPERARIVDIDWSSNKGSPSNKGLTFEQRSLHRLRRIIFCCRSWILFYERSHPLDTSLLSHRWGCRRKRKNLHH